MPDLGGKVAIVTGAGRGIGRAHALALAEAGANVVVNDLGGSLAGEGADLSPAEYVVAEIRAAGGEAVADGENVADFEAARRLVEHAIAAFGALDIVVNNAGILRDRMIFNMDEESWDAVVAVHLKGTFNMCRHATEYWREEHKKGNMLNGRIINTASDAGLLGNVGQTNYGACKAAVATMAIIIGQEMKKYGVTANAIAPVARTRLTVDATPSTAGLMGGEVKEGEFDMWGPQNISPLVAWLASDDAAGCNGQVFRVGGRSVWPMKGWHSAAKVQNPAKAAWDAAELGKAIKAKLAEGITKPETMGDIFSGGM